LTCIFDEKLIVENGRVATTPFTEPIRVLFDLNEVLKESKNKKEVEYDLFFICAPLIDERCSYQKFRDIISICKKFK
jgi:hypothetical protein